VLAVTFPLGTAKMPSIAVEDIGKFAYAIFKDRDRFVGKTVGVAGEHLSGQDFADALTSALGEEVRYNDVPADVYRSFGFPGADDVGNMFQFKRTSRTSTAATVTSPSCASSTRQGRASRAGSPSTRTASRSGRASIRLEG